MDLNDKTKTGREIRNFRYVRTIWFSRVTEREDKCLQNTHIVKYILRF